MSLKNSILTIVICIAIACFASTDIACNKKKKEGRRKVLYVRSIAWNNLENRPDSEVSHLLETILAKASRYLVSWLREKPDMGSNKGIRAFAFNTDSLALILRTGTYSEEYARTTKTEAEQLVWSSVRRLCCDHKANGGSWGGTWQSPLWAAAAVEAAWLFWESGKQEDQQLVVRMLIHEADRIMKRPPSSWNGKGGNSRAEENAWGALIFEIASQMLPEHPHAQHWQEQAIRYRLNAVATKNDTKSELNINGRMVKSWIMGFNLDPKGALVNHDIYPHPNYMAAPLLSAGKGALFYAFTDNTIPEANRYNMELIYTCLTRQRWNSPPFAEPGGTILSIKGTVYWPPPNGQEKERAKRNYLWAGVGVFVYILGIDQGEEIKGMDLAESYLRKTQDHQKDDGRTGENRLGEYNPLNTLSHLYLALCLKENNAIRFTNDRIFKKENP